MIKVDIYSFAQSGVAFYTDELLEFTWLTSCNEGAGFQASLPKVVSTVKIACADEFLQSVRKDDLVDASDGASGPQFLMQIIDVQCLVRKGVTYMSCGPIEFSKLTPMATVEVPLGQWGTVSRKYGLDSFEFPIGGSLPVAAVIDEAPAFSANVKKAEDLLTALAWSFPTRRAIARFPFASAYDDFVDGISAVVFKPARPADDYSRYSPQYVIEESAIIDYTEGASQPAVTDLVTSSKGQRGIANQSFPLMNIDSLSTDVVLFEVKGKNVTAMYLSGQLIWSTGEKNSIDASQVVLGIFEDAFVTYSADEAKAYIYDKEGILIKEIPFGIQQGSPVSRGVGTSVVSEDAGRPVTAYMFVRGSRDYMGPAGIAYWKATGNAKVLSDVTGEFVSVRKTTFKVEPLVSPSYARPYLFMFTAYRSHIDLNSVHSPSDNTLSQSSLSLPTISDFEKAYDFLSCYNTVTTAGVYIAYKPYTSGSIEIVKAVSNVTLQSVETLSDADEFRWSYEEYNSPTVTAFAVPEYADTKQFFVQDVTTEYPIWVVRLGDEVLDSGSWLEWASTNMLGQVRLMFYGIEHTMSFLQSEDSYIVIVSDLSCPYESRVLSLNQVSNKIAQGETNLIDLSQKQGFLRQIDLQEIDIEKGRIDIDIARFKVRAGSSTYRDFSVQNLWPMAIGSYATVHLSQTDTIIIKVIAYSLSYTGVVKATVSGIIVEPGVTPQDPPSPEPPAPPQPW